MYGENTKYHSNPYIQGTTVPCDSTEAPPPKSLEVEPGRLVKMTYSLNDIWIM